VVNIVLLDSRFRGNDGEAKESRSGVGTKAGRENDGEAPGRRRGDGMTERRRNEGGAME